MAKGVMVTPSGTIRIVPIGENPHSTVLHDLQACVGGLIEPIYLTGGAVLYVHEEGLLRGFWPNTWATMHANNHSENGYNQYFLVGDAVVVGPENDETGEPESAPPELLEWAERMIARQDAD